MALTQNSSTETEVERRIADRTHPDSGETYQIASVKLPDGTFLATVNEDPIFRATARTRSAAEDAAAIKFVTHTGDGPGG